MKLVTPSRDTAVRGALAILRFGAVAVGCIILLHAVAWIAMGYGCRWSEPLSLFITALRRAP